MNLLAGDIGGTKTLLAIFDSQEGLNKIHFKHYWSKKWNSFNSILIDFIEGLPTNIDPPKYACIAAAGPIINGQTKLTNLEWNINLESISDTLNISNCEIINDLSVLVYGIPHFNSNQYLCIQGEGSLPKNKNGQIAIIGAGTGLGVARGFTINDEIISLPSEGGHSEFAPRNKEEWELSQWLKNHLKVSRLSIEKVVSGTGLGNIARWRLMQKDASYHPLRKTLEETNSAQNIDLPNLVSKAAQEGDPLMKEVLELWLKAYGSLAGDIALHELCYSGLWIAGGTASKNIKAIRSGPFLKSLANKGRFKNLLKEISIFVLLDREAALFSAACKARINAIQVGDLLKV